jgi:hypothetical protein
VLLCLMHYMLCRFQQLNGQVQLEFERPTAGSQEETARALPVNDALRLIVARGPNNDINSFNGYHGYGTWLVYQRHITIFFWGGNCYT